MDMIALCPSHFAGLAVGFLAVGIIIGLAMGKLRKGLRKVEA